MWLIPVRLFENDFEIGQPSQLLDLGTYERLLTLRVLITFEVYVDEAQMSEVEKEFEHSPAPDTLRVEAQFGLNAVDSGHALSIHVAHRLSHGLNIREADEVAVEWDRPCFAVDLSACLENGQHTSILAEAVWEVGVDGEWYGWRQAPRAWLVVIFSGEEVLIDPVAQLRWQIQETKRPAMLSIVVSILAGCRSSYSIARDNSRW